MATSVIGNILFNKHIWRNGTLRSVPQVGSLSDLLNITLNPFLFLVFQPFTFVLLPCFRCYNYLFLMGYFIWRFMIYVQLLCSIKLRTRKETHFQIILTLTYVF